MTGEALYFGWLVASIGGVAISMYIFLNARKNAKCDIFRRPWHHRTNLHTSDTWLLLIGPAIAALFIIMHIMAWTKGVGPGPLFG